MGLRTEHRLTYTCDWCGTTGTASLLEDDDEHLAKALPANWKLEHQHVDSFVHAGGLLTCGDRCRGEFFEAHDQALVAAKTKLEQLRKQWHKANRPQRKGKV